MRVRLLKAFDRFVDAREMSDREVAALARRLGIDIAVDLNGITEHSRTRIFAMRAAPIQVNFLGYPGTMGAGFMDYLVADGTVVPRAQQDNYDERIVYLRDCLLPFDSTYASADRTFSREELRLPAGVFVYCSFNNNAKITPAVFDSWMRILSRVPGSVLWLSHVNAPAARNIRMEATQRGIDAQRLIFADRMESLSDHLARLRAADLFLDTAPYNAHSSAFDALWAGLPVLTCPGQSFASRVAASLLRTAGLPQLIVASRAEYEDAAIGFAADSGTLAGLRQTLAHKNTPLFATERYTRNLERAYEAIYRRYLAGEAPAHVDEHLAT
jgi:predicted O-linked N-acetylglucosamine transferase (SPINDLY family)